MVVPLGNGIGELPMKNKSEVVEMLNVLADCEAQKDVTRLAKQEAVAQVYTPEIKEAIADIEAEFAGKDDVVDSKINGLRADIKDSVLELGETVRGEFMSAVWNKGRISWDNKALQGYAINQPELLQFKKEGKPSISLRKV